MTAMDDRKLLEALMSRGDAVIYAKDIAPIVHMHPQVIIDQAKRNEWDQDHNGCFIRSGNRVKFNRADFVAKWRDRI